MKTKFFFLIVCNQLFLISFLGYKIYQNKYNVLGSTTIKPIIKESIEFRPNKKLSYYYEPKAGEQYIYRNSFYTINNDTLHETRDYTIEKPKNVFRIVSLGDSFTFGLLVQDVENWPKQLEQIFSKQCGRFNYEVINLGMEGYDIEYAMERYKTRGTKYNPDLVLWLHVDFLRNREMQSFFKKYENYKRPDKPYYSWKLAYEKLEETYLEKDIVAYQKQLLTNYAKDTKIPTVMFVLSTQGKYFPIFEKLSQENSKIYSQMIDYGKDLRIPGDGHPSEYGHQVIAQDVYDYLIKNKLVPCN
jgi:lysophospholipase L1-like esterase